MSVLTYLNPEAIKDTSIEGIKLKDASIEGIKLKDGSISASKIDGTVASKTYVDTTVSAAIAASDAMVFKGTLGTGGTAESLPSTAIIGDTYKVISLTTIPSASSYTGTEETAKGGDLIVAMTSDPKWIVVPSGDEEITTLVQSITWSDLKAKRDTSRLIPGMQYRITDYTCTTTTSGTQSAGHVFDIIVTADSESILNEEARAALHADDTYFANCDLNAWKIWYSLDNDTTRFAWADSTNGKGVIYRMIDEFDNDCPYDFKNIQFYRQWNEDKQIWSTISSDATGVPCYTFSSTGNSSSTSFRDYSLDKSMGVYSNVIKGYISSYKQTLNNNCFFGDNCSNNSFGSNCYDNSFGDDCYSNSFGNRCYSNSFGNRCYSNSFGEYYFCNSFGIACYNNSFGNNCQYNSFGRECIDNTFGNKCQDNTFGNNCHANSFGNDCRNNCFGNYCDNNSFGNYCNSIKFASDSSASTKYNFYTSNHFGDGCQYILFTGTETASDSAQVQNYNFAQGVQGEYDFFQTTYLTIDGVRNRTFETKVAKNSNGDLKIYCEADLIK